MTTLSIAIVVAVAAAVAFLLILQWHSLLYTSGP